MFRGTNYATRNLRLRNVVREANGTARNLRLRNAVRGANGTDGAFPEENQIGRRDAVFEMADKPIRPAATVLLMRDGDDGPEVFMQKRPGRGDFPDLHVFPGGKVDASDATLERSCVGLTDVAACAALGLREDGLKFWVTAIRECFEEAGVLLAYRDGDILTQHDAERPRFKEHREALLDGSISFHWLLRTEHLELATDRVLYHSHWITPAGAPARFDVRFFVTAMPEAQEVDRHEVETVAGDWVVPERALELHEAGEWQMIYPTLTTLGTIAGFPDVSALLEKVRAREHLPEVTEERHIQGMQHT